MRKEFRAGLRSMRWLVLGQKAARLAIRAAWLGGAGYLLGWGLNAHFGLASNPDLWKVLGAALAAVSLVGLARPWPAMARLAWRLDRKLGFSEQVSSAWMVVVNRREGEVLERLIEDASGILQSHWRAQVRRGWGLVPELEGLLVVGILLALVQTASLVNPPVNLGSVEAVPLPPLAEEPTLTSLFPSGIPDAPETEAGAEAAEIPAAPEAEAGLLPDELTPGQLVALASAVGRMGQRLEDQSATRELGEALRSGNTEAAIRELEDLNLNRLSAEGIEDTAETLSEAGAAIEGAGLEALGQEVNRAAEALREGQMQAAEEALRNVGEALSEASRRLSSGEGQAGAQGESQPASGDQAGGPGGSGAGSGPEVGSGDRQASASEPLERLEESGGLLEFGSEGSGAGPVSEGEGLEQVEQGEVGSAPQVVGGGDASVVQSFLTPYSVDWRLRDIIAQYFAR